MGIAFQFRRKRFHGLKIFRGQPERRKQLRKSPTAFFAIKITSATGHALAVVAFNT
jgi:hypothetical protein